MRFFFPTLLCALSLSAQTRDPFPADFTPSSCAPADSCQSFPRSSMPSAAFNFLGLSLDAEWIEAHAERILDSMALACRRQATCLATPGNTFAFCDDVLAAELQPLCEKLFGTNDRDRAQCVAFRDTYLLGIDQRAGTIWKEQQECAKKTAAAHDEPLEVWMDPPRLPAGFSGTVRFFALDPDKHVPVLARITFEGQRVYSAANPAGNPATFYPIEYALKYTRVPNAEGHTELVPPMIIVTAPAYPDAAGGPPWPEMRFRLAADVPTLVVEMTPPAEKLRRGANNVTIAAHDAATGKPVEMRVYVGADAIGNTNTPLSIEVDKSGHRPEIWLRSLFDQYSDVVVARASP